MKKKIGGQILRQSRDKLGNIEIVRTKGFKFTKPTESEIDQDINLQHIIWTKKYYTFDRGDTFDIGINFYDYEGTKLKQRFDSNESGGCYDGLISQYTNAMYGVRIYSDADRDIVLPIEVDDYTNLSIYKEEAVDAGRTEMISIMASGQNYYVSGKVNFSLQAETWTTIYVFAYFFKPNSFINIFNGLLDNIDRWAMLDESPPDIPIWFDPPVTTELMEVSLTTGNILSWFIPESADWAGHHIYSRKILTIADYMGDRIKDM